MAVRKSGALKSVRYPALYQVNTRVRLTGLTADLGRQATLDDIPDTELDRWAETGFDWIWFLSVWSTGRLGRAVSLAHQGWREEFRSTLPDLSDADIGGSGFAIAAYRVPAAIGGNEALKRLRSRLNGRGLRLMLDFVPNHMGPDHPWAKSHPEYFVAGSEDDLRNAPRNYTRLKHPDGERIVAYGRDPYFDGWPDTLQLDYSSPDTVAAMRGELDRISGLCDGVRCDMAMLILPAVFERTWGRRSLSFWPEAIGAVRKRRPEFRFMAEVYWDMEWDLQQLGFDYTYDKRLYDRLREGHARPVREHFFAGMDFQDRLARFLENHDEPRAAAVFEPARHRAAAVVTFFSPGLRFFHEGQFEGRLKRISPHLVRAPEEPVNGEQQEFYGSLLSVLARPLFRDGRWTLADAVPAWHGNHTWENFILFYWADPDGERALVTVNYADHPGQCYVRIPYDGASETDLVLRDLIGDVMYVRNAREVRDQGFYLDMPGWGYHVFVIGE